MTRAAHSSPSHPQIDNLRSVPISNSDSVKICAGLTYSVVIRSGDPITAKGEHFGSGNDFLALQPSSNSQEIFLWANHESPDWIYLHGEGDPAKRSKVQIDLERQSCGGSWVKLKQDARNAWRPVVGDSQNFRITAETPIPFSGGQKILNSSFAQGTLTNCSGGTTPWGSILSCEENFDNAYGDVQYSQTGQRRMASTSTPWGWNRFYPEPPEHYGWVVEIDPVKRQAQKLLSLGRFHHEGALVVATLHGRCVVYMGDDTPGGCIYKFISDEPMSLQRGKLYVADVTTRRWKSLAFQDNPKFKSAFGDELQTLIRTQEAARIVGGSPMPRPEGMARDPLSGAIFVALTATELAGRPYGSIIRIDEDNSDPLALKFEVSDFAAGGPLSEFANPDNLAFDSRGNLWMTTDVSTHQLKQKGFESFGNNSLVLFPRTGKRAGQSIRVATSPRGAEFTGPAFSRDGRYLFLSVQHPGEGSRSRDVLLSTWPDGGRPRSAVIAIEL